MSHWRGYLSGSKQIKKQYIYESGWGWVLSIDLYQRLLQIEDKDSEKIEDDEQWSKPLWHSILLVCW